MIFPLQVRPASDGEASFHVLINGEERPLAVCDGMRKAKFIVKSINAQPQLIKVSTKMMNRLLRADFKSLWPSQEEYNREMREYNFAIMVAQMQWKKAEKGMFRQPREDATETR